MFSAQIDAVAEQLLSLRMLVEATLDFPEEEIEFLESANALPRLAAGDVAAWRERRHSASTCQPRLPFSGWLRPRTAPPCSAHARVHCSPLSLRSPSSRR